MSMFEARGLTGPVLCIQGETIPPERILKRFPGGHFSWFAKRWKIVG